ncbi:Protein REVEILLE 6, variant 2 [Ancistrocladus abbreviatus]
MALPGLNPFNLMPTTSTTTATANTTNTASLSDDSNKKIRKPYTITKSRESWTEPEHDKFFEALQLFDRDWKKIEAYVGSKTVIQIRSHAQKYFLKVQKSGSNEHLPPPRPKRKAAHPYPQKAPKNVGGFFETSSVLLEPGCQWPDSSSMLRNPGSSAAVSSWTPDSAQTGGVPHGTKGDVRSTVQLVPNNCSSSAESTPVAQATNEIVQPMNHGPPLRVLPDFVQVYSFIGSVFDPDATEHLQRLKRMDPIDVETVLLLMRNLSINLSSPDFEDHRRLLASYDIDPGNANSVNSGP